MTNIYARLKTTHRAARLLDILEGIEESTYHSNFSLEDFKSKTAADFSFLADINSVSDLQKMITDYENSLSTINSIEVSVPFEPSSDFILTLYEKFLKVIPEDFLLKFIVKDSDTKISYSSAGKYKELSLFGLVRNYLSEVYGNNFSI